MAFSSGLRMRRRAPIATGRSVHVRLQAVQIDPAEARQVNSLIVNRYPAERVDALRMLGNDRPAEGRTRGR